MDFKKFGNFNWIEMDSKDRNLDLTNKTNPFLSISIHFRLPGRVYYMHARTYIPTQILVVFNSSN